MKRLAWFCFLPFLFQEAFSGELHLDIHGAAWAGVGEIENSEYTKSTSTDYNKNWLQQSGTVVALSSKIDDSWDVNFGAGVVVAFAPLENRAPGQRAGPLRTGQRAARTPKPQRSQFQAPGQAGRPAGRLAMVEMPGPRPAPQPTLLT